MRYAIYPLHMGVDVSITTCPSHVTLCGIYINTCLSSCIVHLPKAFGCRGVDNRIFVLLNSLCVLFPSTFFRAELLPSLMDLVLCVQLSSSYRFWFCVFSFLAIIGSIHAHYLEIHFDANLIDRILGDSL